MANPSTASPDLKHFKQGNRDYIALALERVSFLPGGKCGVAVFDATSPTHPELVVHHIGDDWCDVHNTFVEKDPHTEDGIYIYVAATGGVDDLRVLQTADLTTCDRSPGGNCLVERGKYSRTDRGFGGSIYDWVFVHDATVIDGIVYIAYWTGGVDFMDATPLKQGETLDETDARVTNITPPPHPDGFPFLAHHAFPSADGAHVFFQDEVTFVTGSQTLQMWTTTSPPTYVDGIVVGTDVPISPNHNLEVRDDLDFDGDGAPDPDRLFVGVVPDGASSLRL